MYDGTVNPIEFLQIYTTAVSAAGGNEAVMATYLPMVLSGPARSWMMNLPRESIDSWAELSRQFVANFIGTCARPGTEADLHAVCQQNGKSLRAFNQRFSQVRSTIPRVNPAAVIVAYRQGVRDKKMLEKLATREVRDVAKLFSIADKCARAAEGRQWHTPRSTQPGAAGPSSPEPKRSERRRNKKKEKQREAAGVSTEPEPSRPQRQDKRPRGNEPIRRYCPVHDTTHHDASECRAIRDLANRFKRSKEEREQKEKQLPATTLRTADPERGEDLGFQAPQRTVNVIFGGSGGPSSRREVKTLRREVLSVVPRPQSSGPLKWAKTPIMFDSTDCPGSMAGAGQLPLIVSPTIANVRVRHVLIDGGAGLNILSLHAFLALQIPLNRLAPTRPFSGVAPGSVIPL